ncbi:P-loop containing nucleoside triphosphate hydrolase protein [Hypoxylon trugodes]|uniref:P-loop containing nucleoside triphosphate hydrolase protein n=1 Tax=Hypoxylon trugodes TaxID=326681 RepID=UPI0021957BF3|nr:P-loop containing nucleoside triphosphate hydrolase protein [Hypoxylon trugodes]KAI1386384.1 P-loop containing nucleoside triphosphate hydrolase protein [Hypoxylon trugodes]
MVLQIPSTDSTIQPPSRNIVFVLGPPGCGKGTLCKSVATNPPGPNRFYKHLSTGDHLRELCAPNARCDATNLDLDRIRHHLREQKLLPSEVLIPILKHKVNTAPEDAWLIDGFPRNIETALAFEAKVAKPVMVIVLDCSREVAMRRFLARGRETSDDEERFNRRYDEYVENMKAIEEHYDENVTTVSVNGTREECRAEFAKVLPPGAKDSCI